MQTLSVDQLVGQNLGNYHIESLLGKGRLNAIYLARHRTVQRTDALTLYLLPERFSPEARQRFLARFRKEASAITHLDHAHILPVYEAGDYAGHSYLVTPYMTNGSLADILKQRGRCEHTDIQVVLEQVIAGLAYAHGQGFIHGTLKPSNIVVSDNEAMQVAGFGLMHIQQMMGIEPIEQPYAHLLSIAGTFLAAPEYIAPEVVQGQAVDARSDIYALGCILFELLSGRPPFTGSNPIEVAEQHVKQSIPSLHALCPNVPLVLISVVNQALERDPARRFQHVSDLGEAFKQASRGAAKATPVPAFNLPPARMERLQETPHDGNNWQLLPPIVTGKFAAIALPGKGAQASGNTGARPALSGNTGARPALPGGNTGRMAMMKDGVAQRPPIVAAPPTLLPIAPREMQRNDTSPVNRANDVAPVNRTNDMAPVNRNTNTSPVNRVAPAVPVAPAPAPAARAVSSGGQEDLAKAYEWWSQPGLVAPPAPAAAPAQPAKLRLAAQEEQPLRPLQSPDWASEPVRTLPTVARQRSSTKSTSRESKLSRRSVVALMVTGGVVAAGIGYAAINLGHANPTGGAVAANPPAVNKPAANQPVNPPANQAKTNAGQTAANPPAANGNAPAAPAAAGHTGTVVGKTDLAKNTAAAFLNPANNNKSTLIHLTNGDFAAYELACTHEHVIVRYDPGSATLVCPAHGAIFDPANGGKVLQGPATRPLPTIKVKVNGDGTITAL